MQMAVSCEPPLAVSLKLSIVLFTNRLFAPLAYIPIASPARSCRVLPTGVERNTRLFQTSRFEPSAIDIANEGSGPYGGSCRMTLLHISQFRDVLMAMQCS